MADSSIFDKLVKDLSSNERKELLQKISQSISVSVEPLSIEEKSEDFDLQEEYQKFGLLRRIILTLKALFTGRSKESFVQELLLRDIKARIERTCPGFMDFKRHHFTEKMEKALLSLKNSIAVFREPLSLIMGEEKEEFIAFFAGSELEYTHIQLTTETSPFLISRELKTDDEAQIRQQIEKKFDEILSAIPVEEKERIYKDFRALHRLHDLCFLKFDDLLRRFMGTSTPSKRICRISDSEQHILALGDRLFGARLPPSKSMLKAIFLFNNQEKLEDPNCDLQPLLATPMMSAEQALSTIRNFNRSIPIVDILRYITEDVNYFPKQGGGGEDWFLLFKNFWRNRIETTYHVFMREVKRSALIEDARTFLEEIELHRLAYYRNNIHLEGTLVKHYHSLSFVCSFSKKIFGPKMNRSLRILHINGDFYKEENRIAFTDAYNGLGRIEERVSKLDKSLSSSGELATKIDEVMREPLPESMKKKRIQNIIHEADRQAREIIEGVISNLDTLMKVINGILYGEVGGEYDTLANLSVIGGRENNLIRVSWVNTLKQSGKARILLQNLFDLE